MKRIRWVGVGVLITEVKPGVFEAIGRGGIAEIVGERAALFVREGLATFNLRERPVEELLAESPPEIINPNHLKLIGETYTRIHSIVLEGIERRQAAISKMKKEAVL